MSAPKYPPAYSREWSRARITECLESFRTDDALHEEQGDIESALADPQWPKSEAHYDAFCMRVLCWIPGKDEP